MKKIYAIIIGTIMVQQVVAQKWTSGIQPSKAQNFFQLREAFNEYWSTHEVERGVGYKKFRRWEYEHFLRLLPDSSMASADINWQATKAYKKSHADYLQKTAQFGGNWTAKGPGASAGGYSGLGRINCMAFHPSNNQTYWVGTPAGGLWKTTNNGASWTTTTDDLPVLGVTSCVINPNNPSIMYIATGDGNLGNISGLQGNAFYGTGDTKSIGVMKSIDGGLTWNTTGLQFNINQMELTHKLLINPNNPQILLAATSDGIYRTTNGGTTWTKTATGHFKDIEFKPGDPNIVHAATFDFGGNAQIFLSTNGGQNFSQQTLFTQVTHLDLAVTPALPNLVDVVGIDGQGGLAGMVYSDDDGQTYQQYIWGSCQYNLIASDANAQGCGGQGMYDLFYEINPTDEYEIWLGGVNTWATPDGGANYYLQTYWSTYQNPGVPTVHADKHFFAFHPLNSNIMFQTNDGGIYRSNNGGSSWADITDGLQISEIYKISVSQNTANRVICGLQDNGSKYLSANTWSDVTGGDGTDCAIDYSNDNWQYAGYVYGQIFRTSDQWATQTTISSNIPGQPQGAWITPFEIDPVSPATIYAGYDKVYKSTNRGNTWSAISSVLTTRKLNHLEVAPGNTQHIYAANFDTLYSTVNGGTTWFADPISANNSYITGIAIDPADDNHVWITLSGYWNGNKVIESFDGGLNFFNYSGTLPNVPVTCIVYENGSNDGLYIGTDIGVFYRDNNMNDWIPFSDQLPNVPIADLDISYKDNKLWAGTFGRGVWKSDLFSASVGLAETDIFENLVVFPNPAKNTVNVKCDNIIEQVAITNTLGQVQMLESSVGSTNYMLDISNLPVGVYAITVQIKGIRHSQLLIVD